MRNKFFLPIWFICAGLFLIGATPVRHEAKASKTNQYITEGFFAAGERTVHVAHLKDVRRASTQGYERIVLDLKTSKATEIPYFQVQMVPDERKVIVSIWADLTYDFESEKIKRSFKKGKIVKSWNPVPRLEDGLSILEFQGTKKLKLEAFYLLNPPRIILDVL